MSGNFHERNERPAMALPPDRSTGLVFVAVSLIVAWFWRDSMTVLVIALVLAAVLLAISLTRPILLRPLNIAWMKLAEILSRIVNPVVMFILFAVIVVPAGLVMQMLRDPLLRRKPATGSYWVTPDTHHNAAADAPSGQTPQSRSGMKNQF